MEGFVFRRRRRGDALGRPVFRRRWVVLDSNNLIVYEGINLGESEAVRRKDSVSLNGVEWTIERNIKVKDFDQRCFALAHAHMDSIYFAFEEESQMVAWIQALEDVLVKRDPSSFDLKGTRNHYKTLDLMDWPDDLDTLQVEDLRHAYRHTERKLRTADMGEETTPMDVLMRIHRAKVAYYSLYSHHFASLHERRKAKLKYTATIRKRETWDGGSSMGFSIIESPETSRVMVHSVSPNLLLVSSLEDIEPYDEISTINGEVVSAWPISRIAQFLSAFRVPNGALVDIGFTRRETPVGEDIDAPYLLAHSLDEPPAVYSYLHSCRQHATDAEDSADEEDEEDDKGPPKRERASFRESITSLFARKQGGAGAPREEEEEGAHRGMNGGDHDSPASASAAGGARKGGDSPKQRQRPSSTSPRFSLFGGGSRSTASEDPWDKDGEAEDGDNPGSPSSERPKSMPRESSSGRFFGLSGKRSSETAAENTMLQGQVEGLKEEVEILSGRVDDFTLKELRLEEEVRDKQRKIVMLEENEQLLCDQIAQLSAELEEFKSGAKHQVAVAKVTGLSIDEKVARLRERYGISAGSP
jgi:hypothetical protein